MVSLVEVRLHTDDGTAWHCNNRTPQGQEGIIDLGEVASITTRSFSGFAPVDTSGKFFKRTELGVNWDKYTLAKNLWKCNGMDGRRPDLEDFKEEVEVEVWDGDSFNYEVATINMKNGDNIETIWPGYTALAALWRAHKNGKISCKD